MSEELFALCDGIHAPVTDGALRVLSPCRKGELAETLFIAGAMVQDWEVFTPFGHAQTADLCLVRCGLRPILVQVKTGTIDRGAYHVSVKRSNQGGNPRPYVVGDFDVLAANLAHAGALCAAFEQGKDSGSWWSSYFEGFYQNDDDEPPFEPGCGRPAP